MAIETNPTTGFLLKHLMRLPAANSLTLFRAAFGNAWLVQHSANRRRIGPIITRDSDVAADQTGETTLALFCVRRQPDVEMPFVSVGRVERNDVAIIDETVSKFHAFFKEIDGVMTVQDARSRNGTFVDDQAVAARGTGPPTPVKRGQSVRFGSASTVFLDAAGVFDLISKMR